MGRIITSYLNDNLTEKNMKLRYFAVCAALLATVLSANAQEKKLGNDVWIGVNGGVISTTTTRLNTPQPYVGIEVGKWFTPAWGARLGVAGLSQFYDEQLGSWSVQGQTLWSKKQNFGELNIDGIFNISQAISKKDLALVDFYLFLGPTMTLATRCTQFTGEVDNGTFVVKDANDLVARFGATAGLGLGFNLGRSCNLGLEWRTAVAPSVFGDASAYRKAENTNRLSLRFAYTFGGRLGKEGFAKKYGRVERVEVEKVVEKVVEKEVAKEVIKEVVKKISNPVANYVFFKIGNATLTNSDKVRLDVVAKAIKAGESDVIYTISGFADKGTGSVKYNQTLSEKRAKAVYDYLVNAGVNAVQLKTEANGGVDNMFFDDSSLSRVTIIGSK